MKLKKADMVFIFLFLILTIISIDLLLNNTHRKFIENISNYEPFQDLATGLLITFWVCLIGNLLPIPTPYTWVVCFSSLPFHQLNPFLPLLIGFIASIGCLIGEMGSYAIGRSATQFISDDNKEQLNTLLQIIKKHPKITPFLIFLFGFTPLNDDLIIVPLGLMKYDVKKTIFFCWLGKLGLMLIFAYNILNICDLIGGESWIISIISLYVLLFLIYFLVKFNVLNLLFERKFSKK